MSKLKDMNKKVFEITDNDGDFADMVKMDVDTYAWFYEQAKRLEELDGLEREYVDLNNDFTIMSINNTIYKEALKYYAEKGNYGTEIARRALGESE